MSVIEWPAVRAKLVGVISSRGLSIGQLSTMTGLRRSTLQGALGNNADTTWGTAVRILAALDLGLAWAQEATGKAKRKATNA